MPITVSRTSFEDFEALQDVVPDNRSDIVQLGRGRMTGSITHLSLDDAFGITTGEFSAGIRATGIMSDSRWCLGYLLETDGPAFGHHHEFGAGDLAIAAPGAERYIKCRDHSKYVVAMAGPQELQTFLQFQPGAFDILEKHRLAILHTSPAKASATIASVKPLLDVLINESAALPDDMVRFYRRNMLELLTGPVCDAVQYRGPHLARPDQLVREIEYYMGERGNRPIHVSDLTAHFGIHIRQLHRAFHDVLGMGPVAYQRRLRLNDVHTALRRDGPNATVKKVAMAHGFVQLGRFAHDYKRMFGELPHQTVKRKMRTIITALTLMSSQSTRLAAIIDQCHAVMA